MPKKAEPPSKKAPPAKAAKKRHKPVTQAELFRRLECVEESMERGRFSFQQLIDDLVTEGYPIVSRSSIQKYQRLVRDRWEEERIKDRELLRDASLRRLRRYYDGMRDKLKKIDPKHADAISLLREMHRIEGVYQPEQIEVTTKLDFDDWTMSELDHFIKTGEEPQRVSGVLTDGEGEGEAKDG